jgi:predicted RNA binding protein YcfA (HicA-like mRNA interferase family)
MSKLEKLVASLIAEAGEYPFSDVKKVLLKFGYTKVRTEGSHNTFRNSSGQRIVIPVKHGRKVKKFYVKETVVLLELEKWYEEQQQ